MLIELAKLVFFSEWEHRVPHVRTRGARHRIQRRAARLVRRQCLAGEDALVALQARHLEQTQIGRDHLAERDADDVPGHQLGDVDLHRQVGADQHGRV
ncbi:MAG: hypothetical protein JWP40_1340 [Blastococcus sp.]|nr:hypothetical protein [Blastococcus sp.]